MTIALAALLGIAAGLGGAAAMLAWARRGGLPIDVPDARRLHQTPTPRGGGIGIPLAGLAAIPLAAGVQKVWVIALVWALANGLMGGLDDYWPMRSRVKFAIQTGAAAAAVALGLRLDVLAVPPFPPIELGWVAYPFTVLWLVWMANVFNFMDGMDALAAGTGIVHCAGFAVLAATAGAPGLAALAAAQGGALAGFLRYNAPPARIFMGDAGSLYCGAVLGGLAVALAPGVPFAAAILLLGTFVWDATYTIVRRLLRGDPMLPHRTHLFQRLALAGWSHARVRAVYFGLALAFAAGGLALPGVPAPAQAAILAAAAALAVGLLVVTRRQEARGSSR